MEYISTRGKAASVNSAEAIIKGIADDGGLYVPASIPAYFPRDLAKMDYAALAEEIFALYLSDFDAQIDGCTFTANTAARDGGAILNYRAGSLLSDCVLVSNMAIGLGGGVQSLYTGTPQIVNCTFVANEAGQGGAVAAVGAGGEEGRIVVEEVDVAPGQLGDLLLQGVELLAHGGSWGSCQGWCRSRFGGRHCGRGRRGGDRRGLALGI